MDTVNKQCIYCGKDLRGRADKKFCDDYCRNAYNNSQNSDRTRMVRNINNALRKNRRILESLLPAHEATAKVSRQILQTEGFNFKFFTHQYQTRKGDVYLFCYEYGYLPLEGDMFLLVRQKEGQ